MTAPIPTSPTHDLAPIHDTPRLTTHPRRTPVSHAETDDTTQERLPGASGTEWTIRHGDHVATVVQVGAALRRYDVGGRPVVSGFAAATRAATAAISPCVR